jgi:hypothetical protein
VVRYRAAYPEPNPYQNVSWIRNIALQAGDPDQLIAVVGEMKRMNEAMSQLMQENLLLKADKKKKNKKKKKSKKSRKRRKKSKKNENEDEDNPSRSSSSSRSRSSSVSSSSSSATSSRSSSSSKRHKKKRARHQPPTRSVSEILAVNVEAAPEPK